MKSFVALGLPEKSRRRPSRTPNAIPASPDKAVSVAGNGWPR